MKPRVLLVSALSILVALAAAVVAQLLTCTIALVTNVSFFGRLSTAPVSPAQHHLGLFVVALPVIGGIVVGVMARFGSKAIRGHGIPEAMEQVLFNESRIPARLTILKPLSSAVAIGAFGRLPIHWMWWPALGGVVVGVVGYYVPRSLGVGYDNIEGIVNGHLVGTTLLLLCVGKFASWLIALASGTSGGTLAPLFTVGGALGALVGGVVATAFPSLGIDPRVAALVGMAAMFAGASHATLASIVFAFETTRQPFGILPLLVGCTAAYLVSSPSMRTSIMTEKIGRRGRAVSAELMVDPLLSAHVRDVATREVTTLRDSASVSETRAWLLSGAADAGHGGYPVLDLAEHVIGLISRHAVLAAPPAAKTIADLREGESKAYLIAEDSTLRDAADAMVRLDIGRLVVIDESGELSGVISRRDVLGVHRRHLEHARVAPPVISLRTLFTRGRMRA